LSSATTVQKALLGSCWAFLLVAFILAGLGLALIFLAAVAATEGRVLGRAMDFSRLAKPSYIVIDVAGVLFALALVLLAVTAATRLAAI
jgi:hypothetical protein